MVVDIGFSIKVVQSNMGTSLQGKKRICEKINKYENVLHSMVDTQSEAPATIYHNITGFYFNVITGLSVFISVGINHGSNAGGSVGMRE